MNLTQLTQMQVTMDESHGFPVKFDSVDAKYQQLTKDLVGLFGEIGEFSNLVKKINISIDHPGDYQISLNELEEHLRQELTDCMIYVLRIGAILDVDLETELLSTMKKNAIRYANLRPK